MSRQKKASSTGKPREFRDGDFVTLKQFSEDNPAWSLASLQWMRFNDATNGMAADGVFIKVGKRVLIDKQAFFRWVKKQGGG